MVSALRDQSDHRTHLLCRQPPHFGDGLGHPGIAVAVEKCARTLRPTRSAEACAFTSPTFAKDQDVKVHAVRPDRLQCSLVDPERDRLPIFIVRSLANFFLVGSIASCIVSDMAKHDPALDHLFHALSDPTRRRMLTRLAHGPAAVTELAGPTGLKLPTVLRHLSVLEAAGLVTSQKDGRVRSCAFQPGALSPMRDWLEEQRVIWELRLDRLDDYYVTKLTKDRNHGP